MSLEKNKSISKKSCEIWSTGNVKTLDQVFAPNCINHQPNKQNLKGIESWKKMIQEFHTSFPDYHDTIEDQIAEGDKVVTRFTSQGTHKGTFMGIAPTNKKVSWTGIGIDRIENGKIVETWVNWDLLGLLEQLGAVSLHAIH